MEKFLQYSEKILYYLILGIGLVGIYTSVRLGENIGGGAIGAILLGAITIADFLNLPKSAGEVIFTGSMLLLLVSISVHLILVEKFVFKLLGIILLCLGFIYLLTLVF